MQRSFSHMNHRSLILPATLALVVSAMLLLVAGGGDDEGLSRAEVEEIVRAELAESPPPPTVEPGLTSADVEEAIEAALADMPQPEPGLTKSEALRGGWSVRQLDRQIGSRFYERTALSKNRASMLQRGEKPLPEHLVLPGEEIKDPFVLEALDLKDEYSESDLEEALVRHLEIYLMELGGDFCFLGRQKRLSIGNRWYRVDLLFFHRGLRCLVVVDLKIGAFTHADAGQMHLYLNYAREHWVREGENPPVGLILCSEKDQALARYALDGLPNNVMAGEYRITQPNEELLAGELDRTRQATELRSPHPGEAQQE